MVVAVPPEHLDALLDICAIEEVEASVIGTFTGDHRLLVSHFEHIVADLDMAFLHDGRPARKLEALWIRSDTLPGIEEASHVVPARGTGTTCDASSMLLSLLRHPTIASKEAVIRRYDHEVQGATVLKPLVGKAGNGPGDAAVLQPILEEQTGAGIVLSNGLNPLYGDIDPYHMAVNAVDEALRNLAAVGGDIERAAILDNFCWGNPTDPTQLGMLVRAVKGCYDAAAGFGTPFISGKDSLNNEYRSAGERLAVIPTLLISVVGVIDDASQTVDMSLKHPGNLLYQIGITHNELAGSHYAEIVAPLAGATLAGATLAGATLAGAMPHVDIETARTTMKALGSAIRKGLVQACHDLSEGGLAVAAAEMALDGLRGMTIGVGLVPFVGARSIAAGEWDGELTPGNTGAQDELNTILLFSESASRFLVEIAPEHQYAFESILHTHAVQDFAFIGTVSETERLVVLNRQQVLIDIPVSELQEAWRGEVSEHA